jgi:hypothetical protein
MVLSRWQGNSLVSLFDTEGAEMCLERKHCHRASSPVAIGRCGSCGSKHWDLDKDRLVGRQSTGILTGTGSRGLSLSGHGVPGR